jgi:hypothetical protein
MLTKEKALLILSDPSRSFIEKMAAVRYLGTIGLKQGV